MNKKFYKIGINRKWNGSAKITPVEVEKETEHCIWIGGAMNRKQSGSYRFYPSFKEAKKALIDNQKYVVEKSLKKLNKGKRILSKMYSIEEE